MKNKTTSALITGDNDMLVMKEFGNTKIVNLSDLENIDILV